MASDEVLSAAGETLRGVPWDKVGRPRGSLRSYYLDLKARRYIRAFVRAGRSPEERAKRGEVVNHWLLEREISSVEIAAAIRRAKR